jgi:hypothetical protein
MLGYRWFSFIAKHTPHNRGSHLCYGAQVEKVHRLPNLYCAQLPGGTVTDWPWEVTDERGQPDLPSALLPKEGLKHYAEEIGSAGRRTLPEVYEQPTYRPYQVPVRELCANARARATARYPAVTTAHRRRHSAQRRHLG